MKRLNIFVDETGEFGFGIGASELYGVSFTFHEQSDDITPELNKLNDRLNKIGYPNMIHMADLIMKRNDYSKIPINKRKSIFNSIYQFSRRIPVKYKTIIIDKIYTDNGRILRQKLSLEINNMVKEHEKYFNKFDKIVMYYDNGQEVFIGRDWGQEMPYSEATAAVIDEEVKKHLIVAYKKAYTILSQNRDKLDKVAAVLMEKEKITGEEFDEIFGGHKKTEE